MKLLTIDIGNTTATLGLFKEGDLKKNKRIASKYGDFSDKRNKIKQFEPHVDAIAIASVVPEVNSRFSEVCKELYGFEPFFVTHEAANISNQYKDPKQVGADRLCNAVQGIEQYGVPLIIVDFGTATTFDVISVSGEYLGGIIAPGIETASANLAERASKLDNIEFIFPKNIIGRTTKESMQSGILFGSVQMVDGLVKKIRDELRVEVKTIATGGLSTMIAEKSITIKEVNLSLTLQGIAKIFFEFKGIAK